jgi:hypothetical protein
MPGDKKRQTGLRSWRGRDKMIIDNKGRLFGKISIIDILIVVIIIVAVAGIGSKFVKSKTASPFVKTDKIQVQFYVEDAPDYAIKAVKIGDPVRESIQNTGLGKVIDIKIDKSVSWVQTDKGEYVAASREGYLSCVLTMEAEGIYGNNGVSINNTEYYIGRTLVLYVGNSALSGRIYDLRKID